MKKISFTDHHIIAFLKSHRGSKQPLDLALRGYFRSHKSLGAHDRRTIGDTLYGMTRWRSALDSLPFYEQLIYFRERLFEKDPALSEAARLGMPDFLYQRFLEIYGPEKAVALCHLLNKQAPTTIRANLLKTTREALFQRWEKTFSISLCEHAPAGIHFHRRAPLFSLPEFREGLFEVQDEGSQIVASLIRANPGDLVLDFCSGSGGKTLAFAPSLQGKGQIYLSDIRLHALKEAQKRLRRAGVQNAQCLSPDHPQLALLKGKCDWVLLDVPCTGSGTIRRNPDQKWRIDASLLKRLIQEQREIIRHALPYLRSTGKLVYATCSLLPEENEEQLHFFLSHFPLALAEPPLHLLPQSRGMDGFFAASLVFRNQ